ACASAATSPSRGEVSAITSPLEGEVARAASRRGRGVKRKQRSSPPHRSRRLRVVGDLPRHPARSELCSEPNSRGVREQKGEVNVLAAVDYLPPFTVARSGRISVSSNFSFPSRVTIPKNAFSLSPFASVCALASP